MNNTVVYKRVGHVKFTVVHIHSVERVKVIEVFEARPQGIYLIRGVYGESCGAGLPCSPEDFYWGVPSISNGITIVTGSKFLGTKYYMWCIKSNDCKVYVDNNAVLHVVGLLEVSTTESPLGFNVRKPL